jgi:hypothetical protein
MGAAQLVQKSASEWMQHHEFMCREEMSEGATNDGFSFLDITEINEECDTKLLLCLTDQVVMNTCGRVNT